MMNLSIKKDGNKIRLFLDGTEIKEIVSYELKSSAEKPTELTLTMLVNYPEEQS